MSSEENKLGIKRLYDIGIEKIIRSARNNILDFVLYTKEDYFVAPHHRELCRVLDKFVSGEIKRLIVMAPPRHGKSELVSRRLPAFILGKNPKASIIVAAYSADLASRMNRDAQRIIDSDTYKDIFPETTLYSGGKKADGTWIRTSDFFEVVGHGGTYRSTGVGGGITGMGADWAIIDDPIKDMEQAMSQTYREAVWNWYGSTLYSRLEKGGAILLTLTRWHEDDLAGRLLAKMDADNESDKWTVIKFSAIAEQNEASRYIGQALWPEKFSAESLLKTKATVGTKVFDSLWQQRPSSAEGGMIKRQWFKFYKELPGRFDEIIQSWDLSVKAGNSTDFTVGHVWGRKGADKYLLDRVKDRMGFPEEIAAIRMMYAKHPKAYSILVEEMANGAAVIQALQHEIAGLIPVRPKTSKEARLASVSPDFEAGNVYFPDPSIAPWINDTIEELVSFPSGKYDDEVDATSQALIRLRGNSSVDIPSTIKGMPTLAPSLYSNDW